ncbi:MAG: hypothetical protein ACI9VI_003538 [Candidatus Azotimanducaceae bacterium]|jgi:hypothetical protein
MTHRLTNNLLALNALGLYLFSLVFFSLPIERQPGEPITISDDVSIDLQTITFRSINSALELSHAQ